MIRRSFQRQVYMFGEVPHGEVGGKFGVYVNVPLCHSRCSFCPFYKELYTQDAKTGYLDGILAEIEGSPLSGQSNWVYFGGGTPNTLSISELGWIVNLLRSKINSWGWGIELLPTLLDHAYLDGLADMGFTKVSLGLESFDAEVITNSGRHLSASEHIADIVNHSQSLGLWVNVDLIVGLPDQTPSSFLTDTYKAARIGPSQVTTYPYMVVRGVKRVSPMTDQRQFELIKVAGTVLSEYGYTRKGVWTFARGDDVYDSSRDELTEDYVGFGPGAFSTYGGWKIVNPELAAYVKKNGRRMAFVAPKSQATDAWRRFARAIYDLRAPVPDSFPKYIRSMVSLLKMFGYIRNGRLTEKGIMFAHHITKAVVESLPFPVQNPDAVTNYPEYLAYKSSR